MARFLLVALILVDALILLVTSDASSQATGNPQPSGSMSALISAPQFTGKRDNDKAHMTLGFRKHQPKSLGSSEAPAATRASTTRESKLADESTSPQFSKEKQPKPLSSSHHNALRPSTSHETQVGVASVTEGQSQDHDNKAASMNQPVPVDSARQGIKMTKAPATTRRLGKHHSMDKSIAGGGVIIGGLATTFIVSIICYIRALLSLLTRVVHLHNLFSREMMEYSSLVV